MVQAKLSLLCQTALLYRAGPLQDATPARLEKEIRMMDNPMLTNILGDKVCMRCRFLDKPCTAACKKRRAARRKAIERALKKGTAKDLRCRNGAKKTKFCPKVMKYVRREITKDANIGITKVQAIIQDKFNHRFSRGGLLKAMKTPGEDGIYLEWFRQSRGGALSENHRLHRLSGIPPCLKRNRVPKSSADVDALAPYLVTF